MDAEEEERQREEASLQEVFRLGFIDLHEFELRLCALRRGGDGSSSAAAAQPNSGDGQTTTTTTKKKKKRGDHGPGPHAALTTTTTTTSGAVVSAQAPPPDVDAGTIRCKKHQWVVVQAGVARGAYGVISEVAPVDPAAAGVTRAYAKEVREATDEDQVAYLHKELTVLTHKTILANPNIVHLYDWRLRVMVSTTDGVHDRMRSAVPPCLIMEICDKSIKDLMRERHYPHFLSKGGAESREARTKLLSEAEVMKVGLDVLNALADLHGALKTYHGDISSKNVMRSRRGESRYVLIDFGSSSQFRSHITTPVSQVYAAPEKLDGDWARCDGRCDVFALAVLLSELLVGRPHRDKSDIVWAATAADLEQQPRLRTWSDLLVSDLVDWRAFFNGTLVADAAQRWDAVQAAAALRRRPSLRQKRERARDRRRQEQELQAAQDCTAEPSHIYSLPLS